MDVLSINISPFNVHGLHESSVTGLKILSVNICPWDFIESVDGMPESVLPGLNLLGKESVMNGLNGLNVLVS